MTDTIMVALITGGLEIVSNVIVALMNSRLTLYRLEQLEKKVEKHNNLVERTYKLEQKEELRQALDAASQELQCDVVVVTMQSCGGYNPDTVIDQLYDQYNYGYGLNRDGVVEGGTGAAKAENK